MTANVTLNPGAGGDTLRADDLGAAKAQVIKLASGGVGSEEFLASTQNPYPVQLLGETLEALENIRISIREMNHLLGQALTPDTAGRIRVLLDNITGSLTLATITTVGTVTTVTTVSTVTNQAQAGGFSINEQLPAQMHIAVSEGIRSFIQVS